MKSTYLDLIEQSFSFPQEGLALHNGYLEFHGVSLIDLINKYGSPFKLLYLPKISQNIAKARNWFQEAMDKHQYQAKYEYCYCTKSCHYEPVVKKAIKEGAHLETSSSFDVDLIYSLFEKGELDRNTILVHNGYKTQDYLEKIVKLNHDGFENSILVLDSKSELQRIKKFSTGLEKPLKIGIRMAIDEAPQSPYYTSRLGIRPSEIQNFYHNEIENDPSVSLIMLHFFIDSGIKDNIYYWDEFQKALNLYVELKKAAPSLHAMDIGGGFPIRNNLGFNYDYQYIIDQIVANIKSTCEDAVVIEPDLFTEFGKYTVGECGAIIFQVLEQKKQNETELWYMIDNSIMNTIPDAWSILEKFILLPINKWQNDYTRINIGGISCDHSDYYNSEELNQQLMLPKFTSNDENPLYIGFFHTGAYQDAISAYGGIKHCLIPPPKLIIIDQDEDGNLIEEVRKRAQSVEEMLTILGYNT